MHVYETKAGAREASADQARTVGEQLRLTREQTRAHPEFVRTQRQVAELLQSGVLSTSSSLRALRSSVDFVFNEVEVSGLKDLRKLLRNATGATLLIGKSSVALPGDLIAVITRMVESLERDGGLTMIAGSVVDAGERENLDLDTQLSSQEAADILNVSRPHVVKLAQQGALPHRKVGNRHRFLLRDVLEHDQEMAVARDQALRELAPEGGYTAEDF